MLYPMLALMFWTLCVALYLLTLRIITLRNGTNSIKAIRLNTGETSEPPKVLAAGRNYDNLFQVPVLFYLACVTSLAMGLEGPVALAWGFVALRVVHSLIHLSYNHVLHRFMAFMAGNLLLVAMWVMIALQLGSRG